MRILIFAAFFSPFKGGYATNIFELSKRLVKKGHEVSILTTNTHEAPKQEKMQGISITRLSCWNWAFLNSSYPVIKPTPTSFRLLYKLFKNKYDIISTQTRFFITSFLGFLFAKMKRIPLFHTERGSRHTSADSKIIRVVNCLVDHTFGSLIIRYANEVIGVSEACCQFAKHLGAENPHKISNGIDVDDEKKPLTKTDIKKKGNEIIIVFVGRIIFAKGTQDLLKAFASLNKRFNNIRLLIIGEGPYLGELKGMAQKMNIERVDFLGEKNKQEVMEILQQADIFVNPSYSEGLPTAVLEAGAADLPVIATDVGGTKEIIKNSAIGILIEPKKPKALAKHLERLIKDRNLRQELGKNIKELVKQEFNWDKITSQYIALFEKYV